MPADLTHGARILVGRCARVRKGEHVVIVTDEGKLRIAQALFAEVRACGGIPTLLEMPPRTVDAQEPPEPVAAAMQAANVVFTPVTISITHTAAVKQSLDRGARVLALSAFTEEMMQRGGIDADFPAIAPVCRAIAERFARGRRLHLTNPAGTRLVADITGRRGNAMTGMPEAGHLTPVPTIEANVSPVEGTAKGVVVADASIPYLGIGVLREPVRLEIGEGIVTRVSGGAQAARLDDAIRATGDPNAWNVAEVGVGLNPNARMIGVMLEDEAVEGTVHIGIGTSITLGGTVKAASHYDVILWRPTLEVDGERLLENGRILPRVRGQTLDQTSVEVTE